jgi:hypothetical protein
VGYTYRDMVLQVVARCELRLNITSFGIQRSENRIKSDGVFYEKPRFKKRVGFPMLLMVISDLQYENSVYLTSWSDGIKTGGHSPGS